MSSPLRGVVFDLFGTLVPNYSEREFGVVMRDMSGLLGVEVRELRRLWVGESWRARATGVHADAGECARWVLAQLGRSASSSTLHAVRDVYLAHNKSALEPFPGVVAVLDRLRRRGLKIGLLSDCSSETVSNWESTPFARHVAAPVFSCLEGRKKPDPLLFQRAVERLRLVGADCAYVADGGGRELHVARESGMRAVRIEWEEQDSGSIPVEREQWQGPSISGIEQLEDFLRSS